MNKSLPLGALIIAGLLTGCGAQSSSTAATATSTTSPATSAAPTSAAPTSAAPVSSSAATTGTGGTSSATPGSSAPAVPPAATEAAFTYVGPTSAKPLHVTKTVTGATYQRLAGDLRDLKPLAGTMQCNVLTGESATITLHAEGHTTVFTVSGAPCRGVSVTRDGASQPGLTGSTTLVNQVRAIAGFTGMAHPLSG